MMDKPTMIHLGGGLVAAILAGLSLCFEWPGVASLTLIAADLYLIVVLVEAANRSARDRKIKNDILKAKRPCMFEFPKRSWSLLQVLFLVFVAVSGFAALYIHSGDVLFNSAVMTDKLDAFYYSIVTITTLGYGEFAPSGGQARWLVVWQLGTGLLLLLGIFPLVVARVADF